MSRMIEEEHESFQKLSHNSQEQILESSRQSRHGPTMREPVVHTSNNSHRDIFRSPAYRSCFKLSQRTFSFIASCLRCSNSDSSFVDLLDQVEIKHAATLSEEVHKLIREKIIKLKIIDTSRLSLDPNVMHPFVKVHFVDKNTGCYLKIQQDEPLVYNREHLTPYDKIERKYESTQNDMVLPIATPCCDFKKLGNSRGYWDTKFYLNCPAEQVMDPHTLILFQILDFNHQALLYRDTDLYCRDNFYRVAWGYLRPVGVSCTHMGKQKIELFRYKFNTKEADESLLKSFIPRVYYDFLWPNHEKYEGYLNVLLSPVKKPKYRIIEEQEYPMSVFEEQMQDRKYFQRFDRAEKAKEDGNLEVKLNKALLKFYRNREICEVPRKLIYKLESEVMGCHRVKFIGNNLFAACSSKANTKIKVFRLDTGEKTMTLRGHSNLIYSMQSSPNEKYLITAGSDSMIRVWLIPDNVNQYIQEDESEEYLRGECVHSAAVYSTSVIHYVLQEEMLILSCCFDGLVRLWHVDLKHKHSEMGKKPFLINTYERSSMKVYPTASVYADNCFIVGDSLGDIRIFDISKDKSILLRCLISNEELKNDPILTIQFLNKSHLIIQAADNLIRHYELIGNKLILARDYSGASFDRTLVNCAVSPDNKYLLSPSESGLPFLWDIITGIPIDLDHLNLTIRGNLTSCDWHNKYNLVAFSGFVANCPIFVYGNTLNESEIKIVAAQSN